MSHWNGKQIVRWPSEPLEYHEGWTRIDCGCCNGLEWGGEEPRDCRTCGGNGTLVRHDATRRLALYPGGPFAGSESSRA